MMAFYNTLYFISAGIIVLVFQTQIITFFLKVSSLIHPLYPGAFIGIALLKFLVSIQFHALI